MWMGRSLEKERSSITAQNHHNSNFSNSSNSFSSNSNYSGAPSVVHEETWKEKIVENGSWLGSKVWEMGGKLVRRNSHTNIPDHPKNDGRANWMAELRTGGHGQNGNSNGNGHSFSNTNENGNYASSYGYQQDPMDTYSNSLRPKSYSDANYGNSKDNSYRYTQEGKIDVSQAGSQMNFRSKKKSKKKKGKTKKKVQAMTFYSSEESGSSSSSSSSSSSEEEEEIIVEKKKKGRKKENQKPKAEKVIKDKKKKTTRSEVPPLIDFMNASPVVAALPVPVAVSVPTMSLDPLEPVKHEISASVTSDLMGLSFDAPAMSSQSTTSSNTNAITSAWQAHIPNPSLVNLDCLTDAPCGSSSTRKDHRTLNEQRQHL